jgi:hypothetical protein
MRIDGTHSAVRLSALRMLAWGEGVSIFEKQTHAK